MGQQNWTSRLLFFPRSQWAHVQHRIVEAFLTVVVVPPLTLMSEQGRLQKSNSLTCMSARADASHFLSSKRPSRASKYNPNNKGLRGEPCFTPCWHLQLEVTPSLGWLMRTVSLAYIACKHCKKHPFTLMLVNTCHNTSRGTISNVFFKSTK